MFAAVTLRWRAGAVVAFSLEHACAGIKYLKCRKLRVFRCRWTLCTVEVATYGYVVRRIYGVYSSKSSIVLPLYGLLGGV